MRPHGRAVRQQALTVCLGLPAGQRTLARVQRALQDTAGVQVSEFTLGKWRRDDRWAEETAKQDALVREAVVRETARREAAGVVDLTAAYDEVTLKALERIREAIDTLPIKKVADLRVLVSAALDLQARVDLLRAAAAVVEERDSRGADLLELIARYRC